MAEGSPEHTAAMRLSITADRDIRPLIELAESCAPHPDSAILNFERWARAGANAQTQIQTVLEHPHAAELILVVLGASQRLADSLIQNPELAWLFLERPAQTQPVPYESLLSECQQLLQVSTAYTHALDRLRFFKQRATLQIALADLIGQWSQPQVWQSLSDVAEAILVSARDVVWKEFASQKSIHSECPLGICAFGKLGSGELNYSSDIDLVYSVPEGLEPSDERNLMRYAEMLSRALSDAMGRGALYRVDLRLRPFGSSGSLIPSLKAVESYYRSYAEEWEFQALLRARPIVGTSAHQELWESLRNEFCFRPQLASPAVESMLLMRARVEEYSEENDIKRGSGGIRDIEFLIQILQRIYGSRSEDLRTRKTLDAAKTLGELGLLDENEFIQQAYEFLRKLEHRLQIGDQHIHTLPTGHHEREGIARLMGHETWWDLAKEIEHIRSEVRRIYHRRFEQPELSSSMRGAALAKCGLQAESVAKWFDRLPESESFYQALVENRDSRGRVLQVVSGAPVLLVELGSQVAITEQIISGEIEEDSQSIPTQFPPISAQDLAQRSRAIWEKIGVRQALEAHSHRDASFALSSLTDAIVRSCLPADSELSILALGSYATQDLSYSSDVDLVLLAENSENHDQNESWAQEWLNRIESARSLGAPIKVDLRLRPEGKYGNLTKSLDGFRLYEMTRMEMWERLALGQCRLVSGSAEALKLVLNSAYGQPLTPSRLDDLLAMKLRIETERVETKYARRHVKLGIGGLSDIEWLVRLYEMRYPTATDAMNPRRFDERIRSLGRARILHAIETEFLLEAHSYLMSIRTWLDLLGFTSNVIPENPDRLDALAHQLQFESGNSFLRHHEDTIERVRSAYNEGIERLRK